MRKLIIISALILAIVATLLSTMPWFKLAFIPSGLALLLGGYGIHISKQKVNPKKTAQLSVLLAGIALVLSFYKLLFTNSEIDKQEAVEQKETPPKLDTTKAADTLDIKFDDNGNKIIPRH
ncbi:hypothetical protein [Formosa haliotis]|uniref:hypothetical protein n=1 Tax=Formosa haliotis TaxID=1555194 RepID=UPI0008262DEB|nr:hypothetical protein [Formosa haliotis]